MCLSLCAHPHRYKELKKHLKNIKKQQDAAGGAGEGDDPAAAQQQPQQHQLQQQEQQQEQQQPAAAPQPQPEQQQQQPAEGDEVGYQPGQVRSGCVGGHNTDGNCM